MSDKVKVVVIVVVLAIAGGVIAWRMMGNSGGPRIEGNMSEAEYNEWIEGLENQGHDVSEDANRGLNPQDFGKRRPRN